MRVIVARHCQTDMNAEGRVQGRIDAPLNAIGEAQAQVLAAGVAGYGISRVSCSDLQRATMTAAYISVGSQVNVWPDARLRECSFGSLDGLPFEEFNEKCGEHNRIGVDASNNDFTPFGGERAHDVLARQLEVLDELKRHHDHETVMVIGHGRSLRILLTKLGLYDRKIREQGSHLVITY